MNRISIPRSARLGAASIVALVTLLFSVGVASAHEHREVGEYSLTVGFMSEPALVGEPNGISLEVIKGHVEGDEDSGTPVEGLAETLKAEVTFAGESKQVDLRGVFGTPGAYKADIIPTQEGAYTFRFFGTIEGTDIDESFTSGPETFSEAQSTDSISFPAATEADGGSAVADAEDKADSARTLAIVGIVAGVLGLAAGAAGMLMAMNAKSARATGATTTTVPESGD